MLDCCRQVNLGENGEYLSADLHSSGRFHSMGGDDSIYVCEVGKYSKIFQHKIRKMKYFKYFVVQVCKRDYKCYRSLGDHRRHYHKLPFRQERLGNKGELSSHDLHPELKNIKAPTEDSVKGQKQFILIVTTLLLQVYVCEVCKNDYKTYTKLKYHRKHTHKLQVDHTKYRTEAYCLLVI